MNEVTRTRKASPGTRVRGFVARAHPLQHVHRPHARDGARGARGMMGRRASGGQEEEQPNGGLCVSLQRSRAVHPPAHPTHPPTQGFPPPPHARQRSRKRQPSKAWVAARRGRGPLCLLRRPLPFPKHRTGWAATGRLDLTHPPTPTHTTTAPTHTSHWMGRHSLPLLDLTHPPTPTHTTTAPTHTSHWMGRRSLPLLDLTHPRTSHNHSAQRLRCLYARPTAQIT